MSSKSHVLNLYDLVDGSKHYYQKVYSDRVDFESNSLPMNFKASSFNLANANGSTVPDVVGFLNGVHDSIEQEISDRDTAVTAEASARESADSTLQANIDTEKSDRQAAIGNELIARSSADTTLQANIYAEVSARQAAITA